MMIGSANVRDKVRANYLARFLSLIALRHFSPLCSLTHLSPTQQNPGTSYQLNMTLQPFRLMDLPKELRRVCTWLDLHTSAMLMASVVMVYERLPRKIRHLNMQCIQDTSLCSERPHDGFLVIRTVPTSILAVSRAVNQESEDIVRKIINQFVLSASPKLVRASHCTEFTALETLNLLGSAILEEYEGLERSPQCKLWRRAAANIC
jgi:hypothetical protein